MCAYEKDMWLVEREEHLFELTITTLSMIQNTFRFFTTDATGIHHTRWCCIGKDQSSRLVDRKSVV